MILVSMAMMLYLQVKLEFISSLHKTV